MKKWLFAMALALCCGTSRAADARPKPLFREFMGVNGHTVAFKPKLYSPVCALVRDYHPMPWDTGADNPGTPTTFPMAQNKVDWNLVYGSWKKEGFTTDVSVMFEHWKAEKWPDLGKNAHDYGLAFAKAFGPSSSKALVESAEIGNEPGMYDDASYRKLFENMAKGLREGDPKIKVVTCNMSTGKSGKYDKSVECVKGLENLYDVLNLHIYAMAEEWPTWRRSYPEDPAIKYLRNLDDLIKWRDANAPGKEIWVTEFGWDASTKKPANKGDFAKWVGNTDAEQAKYLVRSFLVFSKRAADRAYIYFFNDKDEPQLHGSSGLTRNFEPKPAYHAVAHLYKTLGEYRFSKVLQEKPDEIYAYSFVRGSDEKDTVVAVWSPTGNGGIGSFLFPLNGATAVKMERMPLTSAPPASLPLEIEQGALKVQLSEDPVYIWLKKP